MRGKREKQQVSVVQAGVAVEAAAPLRGVAPAERMGGLELGGDMASDRSARRRREQEDEELRREIEELYGEVREIFDGLLRCVEKLPGNRRGQEESEDGGRLVRFKVRPGRRR